MDAKVRVVFDHLTLARLVMIVVLSGVGFATPVRAAGDPGSHGAIDVAPPGPLPAPDRPEETRLGGTRATVDGPELPIPPAARLSRSLAVPDGARPGVLPRIDRPPRPPSPASF